jgi:acetyl esterase/lipase
MGHTIPKALANFLNEVNSLDPVAFSIENVRELSKKMAVIYSLPKLEVPLVINRQFLSGSHTIPVRLYHPNPEQKRPLLVYYHGGGHANGSLDTYDSLCRRLALASQCLVLSVGYRLAPEFPFPAGLHDCLAAYQQRDVILKDLQVLPDWVFLAGDSAGGNLALSVCHQMKEQGEDAIKGLVLIYPSVDYSMNYDSYQRNGHGFLLTREKIAWYFDLYFSQGGDRKQASPIHFQHLELLPPIYLAVAEYDPLIDEAILFAEKLRKLGVKIQLETFNGMIHGFAPLETIVPEQVFQLVHSAGNFIKKRCS